MPALTYLTWRSWTNLRSLSVFSVFRVSSSSPDIILFVCGGETLQCVGVHAPRGGHLGISCLCTSTGSARTGCGNYLSYSVYSTLGLYFITCAWQRAISIYSLLFVGRCLSSLRTPRFIEAARRPFLFLLPSPCVCGRVFMAQRVSISRDTI
jgi:hypothetical protein